MRNLRIKHKTMLNKVTFFYAYSPSSLDLGNNKRIAHEGYATRRYEPSKILSKSKKTYVKFLNGDEFNRWCNHIDSIEIDFQKEFSPSIYTLGLCKDVKFDFWQNVLSDFIGAIKDYNEKECELENISHSKISEESARRFLFLAPLLADYNFHIYIDSNSGCFNVDLDTKDNGVLTAFISENGNIHYSYVAQNKKIFKITGTAKFKDSKDFIKFNKVLQML